LAYLDGDLPPAEAAHLEEHLSACPPCIEFLHSYKQTPNLCKRALAKAMPEELSANLTAFLRQKIAGKCQK
jgi:anti-sigma factor RsiW